MPDAIATAPLPAAQAALAGRIDAVLPQTQCTKCGFAGCRPYAEAIASGAADINRCPPGGAAGIARLAMLTGRPARPLDPSHGTEGPLSVAWIDESLCIGCTLCIQACPVDAIVGAAHRMHTVLAAACTGCDLCLPPCPMDCIVMRPVEPPRTWTGADAAAARARFEARAARRMRDPEFRGPRRIAAVTAAAAAAADDPRGRDAARRRARVQEAIDRARRRREDATR
jgi:electron transport complex protein RnfB